MSNINMKKSRSVLITGGNRGIGLAIAQQFLQQGHKVAITYRNGEIPSGVLGVKADVTDSDSLDAAFKKVEETHGPVEILVANAGITKDNLLLRMTETDFEQVINTNLNGTFRVIKKSIKGMIKTRFGRIILISSTVGLLGSTGQTNYAASKAGLIGIARSLTRELGSRGITTNVIAPGFTETDMTNKLPAEIKTKYLETIPLKRFAAAKEIANAVTWIASEEAAYISGAIIPVDGGVGMGH